MKTQLSPLAIQKLLAHGQKRGSISHLDLMNIYPDIVEDPSLCDQVMTQLRAQGISIQQAAYQRELPPMDLSAVKEDDAISLYLKEVSRIPLLSAEEEIELAATMKRGRISQQMAQQSAEELDQSLWDALQCFIRQGQMARQHLIKANFRLVISVAKKHLGRGLGFLDLIQEGNIGLMRAVEKFDYTRGYKLSTYATWWIRQAISRAIADQGRTIRVPVHVCERLNCLKRATRTLRQDLGREPTIEELGEVLKMRPRQVQQLLKIEPHPLSLEMPIDDEQQSQLGDLIEDNSTITPTEAANYGLLRQHMSDVMSALSSREGRVLQLRFGLRCGHAHTLEEVGRKFGVTRERIRQIETKALRKLRQPHRAKKLRDYLS
ncbi:MAG: sigma-70 family RNA polymerase sigma factor [Ardenticatenaceae bacterium]